MQGKITRRITQHDGGREGWKLEGTEINAFEIFSAGNSYPTSDISILDI